MLTKPLITLTTDFGLKDPFVGIMKGVILGINPNASIIDLSHNIQNHNIIEASQIIGMSYNYFPASTIHLAVTDPGVGSKRRPILIKTDRDFFIGPDNGIFTAILKELPHSSIMVFHLTNTDLFLKQVGSTFHGRDIFAPAAAWLSTGIAPEKFGKEINDYEVIDLPVPSFKDKNMIIGEIVSIDNFGNAISNITGSHLEKLTTGNFEENLVITFKNQQIRMVRYYSEIIENKLTAIMNSFGQIELFTYKEKASARFDIKIGDSVIISRI